MDLPKFTLDKDGLRVGGSYAAHVERCDCGSPHVEYMAFWRVRRHIVTGRKGGAVYMPISYWLRVCRKCAYRIIDDAVKFGDEVEILPINEVMEQARKGADELCH